MSKFELRVQRCVNFHFAGTPVHRFVTSSKSSFFGAKIDGVSDDLVANMKCMDDSNYNISNCGLAFFTGFNTGPSPTSRLMITSDFLPSSNRVALQVMITPLAISSVKCWAEVPVECQCLPKFQRRCTHHALFK
jgi:hypothetical protein